MRYLIWGYYGFGNLGDDLLLQALCQGIRARDAAASLTVRCYDAPQVAGVTPFPIERLTGWKPWRALRYLAALWHICGQIDVLVIGGGTLFIDKGRRSTSLLLLSALTRIAKFRRCRILVVGVGIDILTHPQALACSRAILQRADWVGLRDDYSVQFARYFLPAERVHRVADLVFAAPGAHTRLARSRHAIALSLIDYYRTLFPDAAARGQFVARWVELCRTLLQQDAQRTLIFVALQRNIGERDYELAESILTALGSLAARCQIVHATQVEHLENVLEQSAALIAMRFHALVLAARVGCPFLGLDSEMKIGALCREFNMPSLTLESWLEHGLAASRIESLLVAQIDQKILEKQRIFADLNFSAVGEPRPL